jgi:hypothetical protein
MISHPQIVIKVAAKPQPTVILKPSSKGAESLGVVPQYLKQLWTIKNEVLESGKLTDFSFKVGPQKEVRIKAVYALRVDGVIKKICLYFVDCSLLQE